MRSTTAPRRSHAGGLTAIAFVAFGSLACGGGQETPAPDAGCICITDAGHSYADASARDSCNPLANTGCQPWQRCIWQHRRKRTFCAEGWHGRPTGSSCTIRFDGTDPCAGKSVCSAGLCREVCARFAGGAELRCSAAASRCSDVAAFTDLFDRNDQLRGAYIGACMPQAPRGAR